MFRIHNQILWIIVLCLIVISTSCESAELQLTPVDNGYWCNDSTGRKILEVLKSRRLKLEALQNDYDELSLTYYNSLKETQERIDSLMDKFEAERRAYKAAIRRAKGPGLGLFVGPGYNFTSHSVEVVAGIGLVWKLW